MNGDAAYYQRHLKGRGVTFEQINDITLDRISGAQALIVTTPASQFTPDEAAAVRSFRDDGGAVVLLGSGVVPSETTAPSTPWPTSLTRGCASARTA